MEESVHVCECEERAGEEEMGKTTWWANEINALMLSHYYYKRGSNVSKVV